MTELGLGAIVPVAHVRRRVPRATARRIDRLAVRAHRFHRWAHHPLCGAYAGELLRFGTLRVCRGCAYAIAGGAAGGALAIIAPIGGLSSGLIAAAGIGALGASVAWRRIGGARPPKLVTRLLPAAALAFAIARGVLAFAWAGLGAAAAISLAVLAVFAAYRRRGNDRAPCATCPERALSPCSGFAPIVRRERAFQRLSARWLREVGS